MRDVEVMVEDALVGVWRWRANRAVLLVRDLEATVLGVKISVDMKLFKLQY